ncbi:hypothetical protein BDP27DRAFT_1478317 [Rhodocollybia butyracea]|uniref:Uncharacterized protein n=1 Tax=Rhodocollybia butyracea TaxID=206335 RepID=A0A9P5U1A3_9AGAR|nr:hypothetical protein BDP27DRAFT_1478317 [Rhodocollybia butyracea]
MYKGKLQINCHGPCPLCETVITGMVGAQDDRILNLLDAVDPLEPESLFTEANTNSLILAISPLLLALLQPAITLVPTWRINTRSISIVARTCYNTRQCLAQPTTSQALYSVSTKEIFNNLQRDYYNDHHLPVHPVFGYPLPPAALDTALTITLLVDVGIALHLSMTCITGKYCSYRWTWREQRLLIRMVDIRPDTKFFDQQGSLVVPSLCSDGGGTAHTSRYGGNSGYVSYMADTGHDKKQGSMVVPSLCSDYHGGWQGLRQALTKDPALPPSRPSAPRLPLVSEKHLAFDLRQRLLSFQACFNYSLTLPRATFFLLYLGTFKHA